MHLFIKIKFSKDCSNSKFILNGSLDLIHGNTEFIFSKNKIIECIHSIYIFSVDYYVYLMQKCSSEEQLWI